MKGHFECHDWVPHLTSCKDSWEKKLKRNGSTNFPRSKFGTKFGQLLATKKVPNGFKGSLEPWLVQQH